ncbi:MAG: branched-chain amino acid ABC transporter ATP-binding protein, partial [Anaerolineales bacterium]
REKLMDSIREISRRGITILIVEQDVCLDLDLCDRAYVFQEGTVLMEGSRDELAGNPRIKEAYFGIA